MRIRMGLALLAVALLPLAQAQVPALPIPDPLGVNSIALSYTPPAGPIAATGPTTIPITVSVGCALLAQNPTISAVTLSSSDAAGIGLTVADVEVPVSPGPACLSGSVPGVLSTSGDLVITPTDAARGLVPLPFTLTATYGANTNETPVTVQVEYRAAHTFTPADGASFEVHGNTITFDVHETYDGNANSMIMWQEFKFPQGGSMSGFKLLIRDPPAEETFPVTFIGPEGPWTDVTVTFRNYSHHIDPQSGLGGEPMLDTNPVWHFHNADAGTVKEPDEPKDSPAPGILFAVALLGLALVARRFR